MSSTGHVGATGNRWSRVRGRRRRGAWRAVLSGLFATMVACSSAGGDRRPDGAPARVHFARTLSTTAAFQSMVVTVGWKRLASLERGQFVAVDFPPGSYDVRVYCSGDCLMRTIKIAVDAQPGESLYFVIDPDFQVEKNRYVYTSRVMQVDREAFELLLPQLRPGVARRKSL